MTEVRAIFRVRTIGVCVPGVSKGNLQCPNWNFSAPPPRTLRLRGECFEPNIHRRDAEVAEIAQRKQLFLTGPPLRSGF